MRDPERHACRPGDAIEACGGGDGVPAPHGSFGTTRENQERDCPRAADARDLHGINLPMLLRVLNYAQPPLNELGHTALAGGREEVCRAANDF